ncbi:MAG: hypothetical protein QJR13_09670 [Bacillota bacterium]|nr:hypothetical protein [Bacillota bacterium]
MRLHGRKVTPEMLARIPSLSDVFARPPQVELAYLFYHKEGRMPDGRSALAGMSPRPGT